MRADSHKPGPPVEAADTRDAGFYAAVHQMVKVYDADRSRERRGLDRRPYACLQLIAPYRDGRLPDQSQFVRVQCQDLSPGGFAYFSPDEPDFDQLIVALGAVPFTFLTAQVMHFKPAPDDDRNFIIGCRFTGRVSG